MNSESKISEIKKGNVKVFDKLFHEYSGKIYGFAIKFFKSKEEAEGIVQEVFFSLWKYRNNINEKQNFDNYLYTITFNAIRKRLKKIYQIKRASQRIAIDNPTETNITSIDTEYHYLLEISQEIIKKLPKRQKEIFQLSKKEGLSNKEISEKLKITTKTVENNLSLAIKFIKKHLVKDNLITLLFFFLFIQ